VDIADLPENPRIRSAVLHGGSVRVEWEGESRCGTFEPGWLFASARNSAGGRPAPAPKRWLHGSRLDAARDFAWARFADAQHNTSQRAEWLSRLLQDGIAFLSEVPSRDAAILDAAALAGRVFETNYGRVFDVRSVPQPENLAYSDLGLGLHTDNPYREPVPGFQVLHVMVASPDGGESIFGDGLAIAEHLRAVYPQEFAILARTAVPFSYRSDDAELYAERALIELTCDGGVRAVHYNSRSIAPLRLAARDTAPFYAAYRRFAALLRDPEFHLQIMLRDGDLTVFDNQRILHGRTPFSSARHPRHLRGCYLCRDSVYSTAALLRRQLPREVQR
jgi:gamma-butyrobetaine dioxygenase